MKSVVRICFAQMFDVICIRARGCNRANYMYTLSMWANSIFLWGSSISKPRSRFVEKLADAPQPCFRQPNPGYSLPGHAVNRVMLFVLEDVIQDCNGAPLVSHVVGHDSDAHKT